LAFGKNNDGHLLLKVKSVAHLKLSQNVKLSKADQSQPELSYFYKSCHFLEVLAHDQSRDFFHYHQPS
jgi:hypothetical protein